MEGFLTFILLTVLGFYLLGQLLKVVLRSWVQKKQSEFSRQFGRGGFAGAGNGGRARNGRPEGDVEVQQTARTEKKVSKSVGDYVEYEEVKAEEDTTAG